jgi:hypothetical protein
MPTLIDYNTPSPVSWEAHEYDDLVQRLRSRFGSPYGAEAEMMFSTPPQDSIRLHIPKARKETEVAGDGGGDGGGQWHGTRTSQKRSGVKRSQTSGSRARRAVVGKTPRRDSLLALIDDSEDGFENWASSYFVNPRPAPAPPSAGAPPLVSHLHPWTSDLFPRQKAHHPQERSFSMEGIQVLDQSQRGSPLRASFVDVSQPPEARLPSPWSPQNAPLELQHSSPVDSPPRMVHSPAIDSSPLTMPKQIFGGGTIPLPTLSTSYPLVIEPLSRQNTADSSMDRVYIQIQDCITATEKLDEVRWSSSICSCLIQPF